MQTVNVYRLTTHEATRNQFLDYFGFAFDIAPPCTGCPGDLEAAIFKLNWLLKRHVGRRETLTKANELMKYNMKPGSRVYSFTLNLMVTPMNCTDEVAEAIIAENAANAALFTINMTADAASAVSNQPEPVAKKVTIGKKEAQAPAPEPAPAANVAAPAPKPAAKAAPKPSATKKGNKKPKK